MRDGLAKQGIEANPGSIKNFSDFIANDAALEGNRARDPHQGRRLSGLRQSPPLQPRTDGIRRRLAV